MSNNCKLILNTGDSFSGEMIGYNKVSSGELVFTTAMVGYNEALTDPSYFGQILIFAYPLIGNYGISELKNNINQLNSGFESHKIQVSGVIVNNCSEKAFHWTNKISLSKWLKNQKIIGIKGIDTRHLIRIIREKHHVLAKIVPDGLDANLSFFDPNKKNILSNVSTDKIVKFGKGKKRIAVIDCGVKWNILRQLISCDIEVLLIPWDSDLKKIDTDAWFISNGPGNPENANILIDQIKDIVLKSKLPLMGICLGHQIISLAIGAVTKKMLYGHRSHNQPVIDLETKKGYITSQNHGYVVEKIPNDWQIWFKNINDNSVEGIKNENIWSVQFHPEACGGPRESGWIIKDFIKNICCF